MLRDGGTASVQTQEEVEGLSIDICIATFHRPTGLARLLAALEVAIKACQLSHKLDVHIIVVDNDEGGSGLGAVKSWTGSDLAEVSLTYEIEPRRGISHARNRSVRLIRPTATWVAFIDDDEEPESDWLAAMVAYVSRGECDVAAGPVLPRVHPEAPAWIVEGGLHRRSRLPTGTRLPHVGTGNTMIRASWLRREDAPFDARMALSGGEDTLLFWRWTREGCVLRWCDEAVVTEDIPLERARPLWLIKRGFRSGNAFVRCEAIVLAEQYTVARRANRAARGGVRLARGVLKFLACPLMGGRAAAVQGLQLAADGCGVWWGLAGFGYDEYDSAHEVGGDLGVEMDVDQ